MVYVPVAQRGTTKKPGYVPVAQRAAAPKSAGFSLNIPAPTFTLGGQTTPAAAGPTLPPLPNFTNLKGEQEYRAAPDTRAIAAEVRLKNPKFIPDTTIGPGAPSQTEQNIRKLPAWMQSPVRSIVMDIQEGLFGDARQKESVRQLEESGQPPSLLTLLSTEGLLPFLGRSKTDQVEVRARAHEDAGVDPARAASLAFYEVFSGGTALPSGEAKNLAEQAKQRLAALNPTPQEKRTALWSDIGQTAGTAADALNFLPVGSIARSAKLAESLRLVPNTAEGVAEVKRLLIQAGVSDDIATNAAPRFAAITNAKEVEAGLEAIERLQNTTRAPYVPAVKRSATKETPPLTGRTIVIDDLGNKTERNAAGEITRVTDAKGKVTFGDSVDTPKIKAGAPKQIESTGDVEIKPFIEAIKSQKITDTQDLFSVMREFDESLETARIRGFKNLEELYENSPGAIKPNTFDLLKREERTFSEVFKDKGKLTKTTEGDEYRVGMTPKEIFDTYVKPSTRAIKSSATENELKPTTIKVESFTRSAVAKKLEESAPKVGDIIEDSAGNKVVIKRIDDGFKKGTIDVSIQGVEKNSILRTIQDVKGSVPSSETESLVRAAESAVSPAEHNLPPLPKLSEKARATLKFGDDLAREQKEIENLRAGKEILTDAADNAPGRELRKFESPQTGELPEVVGREEVDALSGSGKKVRTSRFGREGDVIMQQLGFDNAEDAQRALDEYKEMREQLRDVEQSIKSKVKDYRDRKAVFDEVVRYVNAQTRSRREKVGAITDFFKLTSADLKELLKGERSISLMTDEEFNTFLGRLEKKATEYYLRSQALSDLQFTIFDKELVKLENLMQALKLPKIEKMTIDDIRKFDEFLQQFKQGDEFLGVRQLQTVKNTDLEGIYTMREARERLLAQINKAREEAGEAPLRFEDLQQIRVGQGERFMGDTTLARQNPFYDIMVHDTQRAMLNAEATLVESREKINGLLTAARNSRKRGLIDRLIPTDTLIFRWLESPDADKVKLAQDMTHEELEAAMYIRDSYAEMRDYLVRQQVLKRFRADYITHIRRGFLEAWKEEATYTSGIVSGEKPGKLRRTGRGLLAAFREIFKAHAQDEAYFEILNQKTGQVLPLEKFFQFSMRRTGELVPSKNVAKAYLAYLSSFEKKKALDSIVPKLDIYVHSLTPKDLTPRGLEVNDSLKRFFKQWMNTKKGRSQEYWVKPGGKLDWGIRSGVALTRALDLGLAPAVGVAANVGEQVATFRTLGSKAYAKGVARLATPKGRALTRKYENFVGESLFKKISNTSSSLGDRFTSLLFGLFSASTRRANQVHLLGSLTPEEWAAGELSPERLARIKVKSGRSRVLEGGDSIVGKSAEAQPLRQYRSWAVPILSSTLSDLNKLQKAIRERDMGFVKTQEFGELWRSAVISAIAGTYLYGVLQDDRSAKERTLAEDMAYKAARDSLSLIGALDPTMYTSQPRLTKFLTDLGNAVKQMITLDTNKEGELTGPKTLVSTLTPGAIKPFIGDKKEKPDSKKPGSPKLPALPKPPKLNLPKLPKLPKVPSL